MLVHLAGPLFDGQRIPVLVFAPPPVHGIKTDVAVCRDLREQPGMHGFAMPGEFAFNLGLPLVGMRLNPLRGEFFINFKSRVIETKFDNGKIRGCGFHVIAQAQAGQLEFRLV